jgi:glycosyltransferase involved in cell wall biosynthesis
LRNVKIYNPVPDALAHFTAELGETLAPNARSTVITPGATEELKGLRKLRALALHIRLARRLRRSTEPVIVTWPLLGWYELVLWSRRHNRVYLIVHDPKPLHPQIGLTSTAARWSSRIARHPPTIICHSTTARADIHVTTEIVTVPHPIFEPGAAPYSLSLGEQEKMRAARPRPVVGVFGQFKMARDTDFLATLGPRLREAGFDCVIQGRDWPEIAGWDVDSRYLSEEELAHSVAAASVVLLPYKHYYQSGVAIRALEHRTPVVGDRHAFLEELLGESNEGIVDDPSPDAWVDACQRVAAPAEFNVSSKFTAIARMWNDRVLNDPKGSSVD